MNSFEQQKEVKNKSKYSSYLDLRQRYISQSYFSLLDYPQFLCIDVIAKDGNENLDFHRNQTLLDTHISLDGSKILVLSFINLSLYWMIL